jgi:hypothetical protein
MREVQLNVAINWPDAILLICSLYLNFAVTLSFLPGKLQS